MGIYLTLPSPRPPPGLSFRFSGRNERDQMHRFVSLLGMPPRHMLSASKKTELFFNVTHPGGVPTTTPPVRHFPAGGSSGPMAAAPLPGFDPLTFAGWGETSAGGAGLIVAAGASAALEESTGDFSVWVTAFLDRSLADESATGRGWPPRASHDKAASSAGADSIAGGSTPTASSSPDSESDGSEPDTSAEPGAPDSMSQGSSTLRVSGARRQRSSNRSDGGAGGDAGGSSPRTLAAVSSASGAANASSLSAASNPHALADASISSPTAASARSRRTRQRTNDMAGTDAGGAAGGVGALSVDTVRAALSGLSDQPTPAPSPPTPAGTIYSVKPPPAPRPEDNDSRAPAIIYDLRETLGVFSGGPGGRRRMEKVGHTPADYTAFIDLLMRMLDYDPASRITPMQALAHPFLRNGAEGQAVLVEERKIVSAGGPGGGASAKGP